MLLTHLPQTVLTAPAKVFEPFRTSQQQLQLITRADLFRDEGARGRGSGSGSGSERETSRQNRKLQKCPIHKYLSVAAGCWLLAAGCWRSRRAIACRRENNSAACHKHETVRSRQISDLQRNQMKNLVRNALLKFEIA